MDYEWQRVSRYPGWLTCVSAATFVWRLLQRLPLCRTRRIGDRGRTLIRGIARQAFLALPLRPRYLRHRIGWLPNCQRGICWSMCDLPMASRYSGTGNIPRRTTLNLPPSFGCGWHSSLRRMAWLRDSFAALMSLCSCFATFATVLYRWGRPSAGDRHTNWKIYQAPASYSRSARGDSASIQMQVLGWCCWSVSDMRQHAAACAAASATQRSPV